MDIDQLFSGAENLGTLLGGGFLTAESYDALGDVGDTAREEAEAIGLQAQGDAAFTGYGVTTDQGGVNVTAEGDTQINLSPEMRALQQQLSGGAASLFGDVTGGTPGSEYIDANQLMLSELMGGYRDQASGSIRDRQNEIFGDMTAAMQPGQDRQRLGMENRLRAQGRQGMMTGMYGGTPEAMAMERGIAEANNNAFLSARGQAVNEQAQGANLLFQNMGTQLAQGAGGIANRAATADTARNMLMSSFGPQSALLDAFNAGGQAYGYEDVARRQGANLFSESAMGGLNAYLAANLGQADLLGTLGGNLLQASGGGLFESIRDVWGGLTGGED